MERSNVVYGLTDEQFRQEYERTPLGATFTICELWEAVGNWEAWWPHRDGVLVWVDHVSGRQLALNGVQPMLREYPGGVGGYDGEYSTEVYEGGAWRQIGYRAELMTVQNGRLCTYVRREGQLRNAVFVDGSAVWGSLAVKPKQVSMFKSEVALSTALGEGDIIHFKSTTPDFAVPKGTRWWLGDGGLYTSDDKNPVCIDVMSLGIRQGQRSRLYTGPCWGHWPAPNGVYVQMSNHKGYGSITHVTPEGQREVYSGLARQWAAMPGGDLIIRRGSRFVCHRVAPLSPLTTDVSVPLV